MSNNKDGMKILVVQLARMGDILQTTAALFGLRQKFPGARIDVLVRKSFHEILVGNPFVNNVRVLDSMHILENLLNRKGSLVESSSRLKDLLTELEDQDYDVVYNLTYSLASSFLTWLIGEEKVYGLSRSNDGYFVAKDDWSKYFVGNVLDEGLNRKHIVDIFRNVCGVQDRDTSLYIHMPLSTKQWFNSELSKIGIGSSERVVTIQPGASRMSKRWDTDNFAELINRLHAFNPNLNFVIVGSKNEEKLGSSVIEKVSSKKIISYVGKTNLQELSAILSRSELLISNDTGTLHIATALDVPVVCISVGPSSVYESGPYSFTRNYTITPRMSCYPCDYQTKCAFNKCKKLITVDSVFELSKAVLTNTEPKIDFTSAQFDVFKGEIINVKTENNQPYSEIKYTNLRGKEANTEEILAAVYGSMWNYQFNGYDERSLNFDTFPDPETIKELNDTMMLLDKLQHLSDIGIRYSDLLIKELANEEISLEEIRQIGQKLSVVDENIFTLAGISKNIQPLTNFFKVTKESFENIDIKELTELTRLNYTRLKQGTNFIYQMLNQVVSSSAVADLGTTNMAKEGSKEVNYVK